MRRFHSHIFGIASVPPDARTAAGGRGSHDNTVALFKLAFIGVRHFAADFMSKDPANIGGVLAHGGIASADTTGIDFQEDFIILQSRQRDVPDLKGLHILHYTSLHETFLSLPKNTGQDKIPFTFLPVHPQNYGLRDS